MSDRIRVLALTRDELDLLVYLLAQHLLGARDTVAEDLLAMVENATEPGLVASLAPMETR